MWMQNHLTRLGEDAGELVAWEEHALGALSRDEAGRAADCDRSARLQPDESLLVVLARASERLEPLRQSQRVRLFRRRANFVGEVGVDSVGQLGLLGIWSRSSSTATRVKPGRGPSASRETVAK